MRHIIILLALLSVSCSSALPSFKPYRMDIQQGNVVTSKMMMQLRPGMTKSQVRFIMGTPLIQDSFHSNRWDYFYQMRQEGKIIEQRRVIMEFENDALARVRGDVIPAGSGQQDLATPATTPESLSKASSAKAKKERGLVDRLKFWQSDEEKKKSDEQPATLVVPAALDSGAPAPTPSSAPAEPSTSEPAREQSQEPASATPAVSAPSPVSDSAPREALPAAEPTPDSVTVEPITSPEPLAAPVVVPVESQPVSKSSESGSSESSEAEMELRLERSIDLPTDEGNPSNVSNPSQAPDADLPSEASPDFFERMLEKIGF